ncbi:MAG: Crp/Fnr family transcriptional regulator, partial [Aquificae bacterium]|nr:Crp/Fnr family transcriptional regulator [Aquificota bacterium]
MIEKIFPSATREEIKSLEKISSLHNQKKGDILFLEGEEPKFIFFLKNGVVKIYKTSPAHGKEITLNYILPNSFIGEFAIVNNREYPFSAEMETDGEIIRFYAKQFIQFVQSSINLCCDLTRYMADKILKNYEYCENLMEKNVRKKIAKFLKEHEDLFFKLNKNKIASILNITPETF